MKDFKSLTMKTEAFSRIKRVLFGAFLLGYSACGSSVQEKKAAYHTIEETLANVCSITRNMKFELSPDLLFCGQNLCVDQKGIYLPKPGEECTEQRWGARYGWDGIKAAHPREFRGRGCVDIESISNKPYSPRPDMCAILTLDLQQAKTLADAINTYID